MDIIDLIEQKRILGYKYESQAVILKHFDQFCLKNYPDATILEKEIVLHWVRINPQSTNWRDILCVKEDGHIYCPKEC